MASELKEVRLGFLQGRHPFGMFAKICILASLLLGPAVLGPLSLTDDARRQRGGLQNEGVFLGEASGLRRVASPWRRLKAPGVFPLQARILIGPWRIETVDRPACWNQLAPGTRSVRSVASARRASNPGSAERVEPSPRQLQNCLGSVCLAVLS